MGLKWTKGAKNSVFVPNIPGLCGNTLSEEMILNEVSLGESPTNYFALNPSNNMRVRFHLYESYKWLLPTTTISQSIAMQPNVQEMVDTSCAQ